jgi:hypothetical protein
MQSCRPAGEGRKGFHGSHCPVGCWKRILRAVPTSFTNCPPGSRSLRAGISVFASYLRPWTAVHLLAAVLDTPLSISHVVRIISSSLVSFERACNLRMLAFLGNASISITDLEIHIMRLSHTRFLIAKDKALVNRFDMDSRFIPERQ